MRQTGRISVQALQLGLICRLKLLRGIGLAGGVLAASHDAVRLTQQIVGHVVRWVHPGGAFEVCDTTTIAEVHARHADRGEHARDEGRFGLGFDDQ